MAENFCCHHSHDEIISIAVRPLARLAKCMSVEGILGHLAEIVTEKGSDLYNIKLKRAGYEREFRPTQSPLKGDVRALEVNVEGGTTRLVLTLKGCLDSYALHEVEDVLLMAAQRIELLSET